MREKQFKAMQHLKLRPEDWCGILGVRVLGPDGWRQAELDYAEPVSLGEFIHLVHPSTVSFEEGVTDFFDAENYLANQEWQRTH